jgi:mono/diheme cytochrome c family protein
VKNLQSPGRVPRRSYRFRLLATLLVLGSVTGAQAIVTNVPLVIAMHQPAFPTHLNQSQLLTLVQNGQNAQAFQLAFETGDEMFQTRFNALDGVGANVGNEQRFTRIPRADLTGPNQWANHLPSRETGPNAEACNACHRVPGDDGSGDAVDNVHRDPQHAGLLNKMIQRNTPHLFGAGAIQRIAEEITADLKRILDQQTAIACSNGSASFPLLSKGLRFGTLALTRTQVSPCQVSIDPNQIQGISTDLVVRPFQWKGSVAFLRDFNRGASHNEIGMQAVELVGKNLDRDGDGVTNEMTVGDQTAFAIYIAAQPRPVTKQELSALGLLDPPLTTAENAAIDHGKQVFRDVGCWNCHAESLHFEDKIFREPSSNAAYRDATFPSGLNPVTEGVNPSFPVKFDLTADQPENVFNTPSGVVHLGVFETNVQGFGVARLYGDLKRHHMGTKLAENIDEVGTGSDMFLTENLWGVGSTAPYMHDGRSTTLTEAILEHGGEAATVVANFQALTTLDQQDLIAFLENLVLIKQEAP